MKIADGNTVSRVFGLVAGPAGVGKTTQATTFPKEETAILSVEDGLLSIEGSGYAYEEAQSYDHALDFIETIQKKHSWVKYLYIDSLTEIYDLLKRELKHDPSLKKNTFAKHDAMYDMLIHMIRVARQLPINVFFTCHTKEDKDGLSLVQNLAFDGKMPEMVKKQFDLVVHLDDIEFDGSSEKTKVFMTSPHVSKIAKKRVSPWLEAEINDYEEPNLYKLTQKLLGK